MRKQIVVRRWEIMAAFLFNVASVIVVAIFLTGQNNVTHRLGVANHRQIAVNRHQILVNTVIVGRLCHVNGALLRALQISLSGPRPAHLTARQKNEIRQLTRIERSLKRDRCHA